MTFLTQLRCGCLQKNTEAGSVRVVASRADGLFRGWMLNGDVVAIQAEFSDVRRRQRWKGMVPRVLMTSRTVFQDFMSDGELLEVLVALQARRRGLQEESHEDQPDQGRPPCVSWVYEPRAFCSNYCATSRRSPSASVLGRWADRQSAGQRRDSERLPSCARPPREGNEVRSWPLGLGPCVVDPVTPSRWFF